MDKTHYFDILTTHSFSNVNLINVTKLRFLSENQSIQAHFPSQNVVTVIRLETGGEIKHLSGEIRHILSNLFTCGDMTNQNTSFQYYSYYDASFIQIGFLAK